MWVLVAEVKPKVYPDCSFISRPWVPAIKPKPELSNQNYLMKYCGFIPQPRVVAIELKPEKSDQKHPIKYCGLDLDLDTYIFHRSVMRTKQTREQEVKQPLSTSKQTYDSFITEPWVLAIMEYCVLITQLCVLAIEPKLMHQTIS